MNGTGKGEYILVVDDDRYVLDATSTLLEEMGYRPTPCMDPRMAVDELQATGFDLVLSDIKMPGITGIELLKMIRERDTEVPVILMTAYAEIDMAVDALRSGAFDFIIKPYKPEYLVLTIEKAIKYKKLLEFEKNYKKTLEETVEQRTRELAEAMKALKESSLDVIKRLTGVAEYRDMDTGEHISRMGMYANRVAEAMRMPSDFVETITFASPMHDIGKIGIPDSILLKEGPLTGPELEVMKTHTTIGHHILSGSDHTNIKTAATIALSHHERWDGSGYPMGLKGADIPIEGMIAMVCDTYDALRSKRPYKEPFSHDEAVRIITEGNERTRPEHYSPDVLKAFDKVVDEFEAISEAYGLGSGEFAPEGS